jgi:hypothetical protein
VLVGSASTSGREATKVAEQLTFCSATHRVVTRHEIKTKWQLQQLNEEKGLQNFKKVFKNSWDLKKLWDF